MIYLDENGPLNAYSVCLSPIKAARKSFPTGFATTYHGAYASKHATETMRKAVFLTPCVVSREITQ